MIRNTATALLFALLTLTAMPSLAEIDGSGLASIKEGSATSQEIKEKYGAPVHEDHNPDGRYVYLYEIASPPADMAGPMGKATVAFLFGKDDKLIRMRFYKM